MTMAKTISKKRSIKASSDKPSSKPLSGDKTLCIDPSICFYAIEDGYDTEEVIEYWLVMKNKSSK